MSAYRAIIDDPGHLRLLEGERFVVLRPEEDVANLYAKVNSVLQERLSGEPASFPAQPHVTLAAFPKHTNLERLSSCVGAWTAVTDPIAVRAESLATFPHPDYMAFVRVSTTTELSNALSSIRSFSKDLGPANHIPVEGWVFHMTLAYCRFLSEPTWKSVVSYLNDFSFDPVECVVAQAQIVAIDEGKEYSGGVFKFRTSTGA